MTDRDRLADALMGATPEMLRGYVRYLAQVEDRLDADGELLATDTREELHGLRRCYRTLAALALAIAEMQEGGHAAASAGADEGESVRWDAFADGQSLVRLGPNDALTVTDWGWGHGHPTLPAALASLLRQP